MLKVLVLTIGALSCVCAVPENDLCASNFGSCTSSFSGARHLRGQLNQLNNELLDKSFRYLILSMTFNKYDLDRPGYEKMFRSFADYYWMKALKFIHYQTRRGVKVTIGPGTSGDNQLNVYQNLVNTDEFASLRMALDWETKCTQQAFSLYRDASNVDKPQFDADITRYLHEKFFGSFTKAIRWLAGCIHNVNKILKDTNTMWLGIDQFDLYLCRCKNTPWF